MLANSKLKSKLEKALQIKLCLANVNKYVEKPFSYLKPKQVDSTYLGIDNDLLCVLPTGYGKTALFNTIPMYSKIVRECKTTSGGDLFNTLGGLYSNREALVSYHMANGDARR
jgi:hypothetical protein